MSEKRRCGRDGERERGREKRERETEGEMDIVPQFDTMRSLVVCGDDTKLCELVEEQKAMEGESKRKRTRQECEVCEQNASKNRMPAVERSV